jgi:hypothetical protein
MDTDSYRKKFYVHPQLEPRSGCAGMHGLTLYFSHYKEVVEYYQLERHKTSNLLIFCHFREINSR